MKITNLRMNRIGFAFFVLLWALVLLTSYVYYRRWQFNSDAFFYYSSIRNLVDWGTTYEGPTFEYLIGNHSYLTIYLLAPFVKIWHSPFILGIVNVTAPFIAAWFLFLISKELLKDKVRPIVHFLIPTLYIFNPLVTSNFFMHDMMFQPDCLSAPLILAIFYYAIVRKVYILCSSVFLLVTTKEEFIPLTPMVTCLSIFSSIVVTQKKYEFRDLVKIAAAFIFASTISLSLLFYFRNLNFINHAVRTDFFWHTLIKPEAYSNMALQFLIFIGPLCLLWFFMILKGEIKSKKILFLATAFLLLIAYRVCLSQLVFDSPEGNLWSRFQIPPVLALTTILLIIGTDKNWSSRLVAPILVTLAFYFPFSQKSDVYLQIWNTVTNTIKHRFPESEIRELGDLVGPPTKLGYIVTQDFLQARFMRRSFVHIPWLLQKPSNYQNKVLSEADYICTAKTEPLIASLESRGLVTRQYQTKNFICARPNPEKFKREI